MALQLGPVIGQIGSPSEISIIAESPLLEGWTEVGSVAPRKPAKVFAYILASPGGSERWGNWGAPRPAVRFRNAVTGEIHQYDLEQDDGGGKVIIEADPGSWVAEFSGRRSGREGFLADAIVGHMPLD